MAWSGGEGGAIRRQGVFPGPGASRREVPFGVGRAGCPDTSPAVPQRSYGDYGRSHHRARSLPLPAWALAPRDHALARRDHAPSRRPPPRSAEPWSVRQGRGSDRRRSIPYPPVPSNTLESGSEASGPMARAAPAGDSLVLARDGISVRPSAGGSYRHSQTGPEPMEDPCTARDGHMWLGPQAGPRAVGLRPAGLLAAPAAGGPGGGRVSPGTGAGPGGPPP